MKVEITAHVTYVVEVKPEPRLVGPDTYLTETDGELLDRVERHASDYLGLDQVDGDEVSHYTAERA